MKNQKKLYIIIFIAIFCIVFIFAEFSKIFIKNIEEKSLPIITTPIPLLDKEGVQTITSKTKTENPPLLDEEGARGGNSVSLETESATLSAGDVKINIPFAPDTIFYDALVQAKTAGTINFSGKNYPGLGFFVTEIGTLRAGGGKSLLYYINGKHASVGVSSYTLQDGDIIEWKLE